MLAQQATPSGTGSISGQVVEGGTTKAVPSATVSLISVAPRAPAREVIADAQGRYAFAVVTWLLIKTISDLGLGVLATREVARRPALAGLWLGAGTTLRLAALAGLLPAVVALLTIYLAVGGLASPLIGALAEGTSLGATLLVLPLFPLLAWLLAVPLKEPAIRVSR